MAVDSNMIHICIYIFTINHFLDTFKKKKKKQLQTSLVLIITEWPWNVVPWLSQNSGFAGMLRKRDDDVQTHEKTRVYMCVWSSLLSPAESWDEFTECLRKNESHHHHRHRRVDSGFLLVCWRIFLKIAIFFFLFFTAIWGLRADERIKKIWGPRLLDHQPVSDQCPSFPPRILFVLFFVFSLRRFLFYSNFFFFYPSRHGMVSPPQIVRNKRLAQVQKYNFNFWKGNMVQQQKIILQMFQESREEISVRGFCFF